MKLTKLQISFIAVMVVLSFAQFFGDIHIAGFPLSGLAVILGIVFFFADKIIRKIPTEESGFDIRLIGKDFKTKRILYWIILPVILELISLYAQKTFLPGSMEHLMQRVEPFLDFSNLPFVAVNLVILALGEEIAWRAFFQNKLSKVSGAIPAVLIASVLFALGHITAGNVWIVTLDIFTVFIHSIIYGIVFNKTKNAWMSYFSHLIANVAGVAFLIMLTK